MSRTFGTVHLSRKYIRRHSSNTYRRSMPLRQCRGFRCRLIIRREFCSMDHHEQRAVYLVRCIYPAILVRDDMMTQRWQTQRRLSSSLCVRSWLFDGHFVLSSGWGEKERENTAAAAAAAVLLLLSHTDTFSPRCYKNLMLCFALPTDLSFFLFSILLYVRYLYFFGDLMEFRRFTHRKHRQNNAGINIAFCNFDGIIG